MVDLPQEWNRQMMRIAQERDNDGDGNDDDDDYVTDDD